MGPVQLHASIDLRAQFEDVRHRVTMRAERCNRAVSEITLVAVTKTHPVATVRAAIAAGATDLGENRVQEAEPKILEIGRHAARWHLIGHLQANKARRAVKLFDVIHSIDSADLVMRLHRLCEEEGRAQMPILLQVDLAGEETKSGLPESELLSVAKSVQQSNRLSLIGLMTLPPFFEDSGKVRPYFARLRKLRDKLRAQDLFGEGRGELSMGMSHDFEIAIEEGATMLRVGTALFGERKAGI